MGRSAARAGAEGWLNCAATFLRPLGPNRNAANQSGGSSSIVRAALRLAVAALRAATSETAEGFCLFSPAAGRRITFISAEVWAGTTGAIGVFKMESIFNSRGCRVLRPLLFVAFLVSARRVFVDAAGMSRFAISGLLVGSQASLTRTQSNLMWR